MTPTIRATTAHFTASKDPTRLNIAGNPDRVLDVWYQNTPTEAPRHFGYCWDIQDSHPFMARWNGKWTFNRGEVPIDNRWWPAIYHHETLSDLLAHLEATFVEGVPANQPQ